MASTNQYLEFVLDLLGELDDVEHRKMMGEYVLYYRGKVVGGIYDDRFLLKVTPASERLLSGAWGCAQVVDGLFMRLLSRPLGVVRIRWGICHPDWCGCGGGCRSLRSRWRPRCRPGRGW